MYTALFHVPYRHTYVFIIIHGEVRTADIRFRTLLRHVGLRRIRTRAHVINISNVQVRDYIRIYVLNAGIKKRVNAS